VSAHVAAQLPLLVRGIFYEGWDVSRASQKLTLAQFAARVEHDANLKDPTEAKRAIRAVMHVLWDELAPGTMDHVIAFLPDEFATVL
jgi:uncharacterized protein (DUF2267 family)